MSVVRITRGRLKPGTWDAFEKAVHAVSVELEPIPGLISRSLLRHASEGDVGYSISVWESEDHLRAYEQSALTEQVLPQVRAFFTGEYQSDHCEVRYWDSPA